MTCETWPIVWPKNVVPDVPEPILEAAKAAAQSLIWSRTGRRLGTCEVTETYQIDRGCYRPLHGPLRSLRFEQWWRGGEALMLGAQPVVSVAEVRIDGALVASSGYWLDGGIISLRENAWHGEVTVTYTWGVPIGGTPIAGSVGLAMGEAALEYCQPSLGGHCRLPANVSSITRQNVTTNFQSGAELADAGLTGLTFVDALINACNPGKLQARSRVFYPGMPTAMRTA